VVRHLALEVHQEVMVEVILLVACPWQRKAKERSSPPKSARPATEIVDAVAAAAEAAERGGRSGQRRVVLEAEAMHGSPPGTIMLGG